jgi:hypothetical protein
MCILYALLSSHLKKRRTPYQTPGQDFRQLTHSGSPSSTQFFSFSDRSRQGGVEGDFPFLRVLLEVVWHSLKLAVCQGRTAPPSASRFIGDHQAEIDADHPAEAAARLARAERRVERERAGGRLRIVDIAVGQCRSEE